MNPHLKFLKIGFLKMHGNNQAPNLRKKFLEHGVFTPQVNYIGHRSQATHNASSVENLHFPFPSVLF